MKPVVKWSVILAVAVAVLSVIFAVLGLHEKPFVLMVVSIPLLILINVIAVFFALKETAAENGYGKQLLNGVLLGLFAGVLVFGSSWVFTTYAFPEYLPEAKEAYIGFLESSNLPAEQRDAQIAAIDQAMTPVGQARSGFLGTFITSVVVAAIVAIWKRRK